MNCLWKEVTSFTSHPVTLYFTFCFRLDWLVEGTGLLDCERVADRLGDGSAGSICSCPSVERGVPVTGATRGKLIFSTVPVKIRGFKIYFGNINPFVESLPVLNFWWHLHWVSKPGWGSSLACFIFWCYTCWFLKAFQRFFVLDILWADVNTGSFILRQTDSETDSDSDPIPVIGS